MSRRLALCADDYAAAPAIDDGIVQLASTGRLTEVSCIVTGPRWATAAQRLRPLAPSPRGALRVGLHFNLTEGAPLSPALRRAWPQAPALQTLIVQAHLNRLPRAALADEWRAQLEAFEQHFGRAPDHIDGHQHVHHLPGVREPLLAALATLPQTRVRCTAPLAGPGYGFKRWVIAHTGGAALARALRPAQRANARLCGAYDFVETDYRGLMRRWLARLPAQGTLLFCHPADGTPDPGDAIAAARQREYDYLASDAFTDDLAEADVRLGRASI